MKSFRPRSINQPHTLTLFGNIAAAEDRKGFIAMASTFNELLALDWDFYVVEQQRGRCYYGAKVITIPLWAMQHKDPDYWAYYLGHEMAHALAGHKAGHGDWFMQCLKATCPRHLQHYEFEYKATAAIAAGVQPGSDF